MKRIISVVARFLAGDGARAARREAEEIAMGIVPAGRRYDRELVERMEREAMGGAGGAAPGDAAARLGCRGA